MAQRLDTEALASSEDLFTLERIDQDGLSPRKPSVILVCPSVTTSGTSSFTTRYFSILAKMLRDAHLIFAFNVADIHRILSDEVIADSIAGFVVTDARVMGVDTGSGAGTDVGVSTRGTCRDTREDQDAETVAMSNMLKDIVQGKYAYGYEKPQEKPKVTGRKNRNRGLIPEFPTGTNTVHGISNRRPRNTPRDWTVVFAFDFPAQAACHPLRFGKYMLETFGLGWRICGATKTKWQLCINEPCLKKMGERVYRGDKYEIRAVFLDGVVENDKVLIVKKKTEHDQKDESQKKKQKASRCTVRERRRNEAKEHDDMEMAERVSSDETDSTTGEEPKFRIERVEVSDRHGGWRLAADANGPFLPAPGEDVEMLTPMIRAELRREERDWADDELTTGEDSDCDDKIEVDEGGCDEDDEGEDSTSSSSSSSDDDNNPNPTRNTRTIYLNPDQRGQKSDSDADDVQSPKKKKQKRSYKPAKRIANCPVALHDVRSWLEKGDQRVRVYGYVGFVGHVEDNRSMASLILGMCGVRNTAPLPQRLATWLRENRLR
ncbi:uncharacterized protein DSM5745_04916 [Aspergillus mulundensis]|uniref:Uncharacterized protein n=1 Tax=Aspergillus mulundensis TaxID=1810919 RepID=A0A3D8S4Z5_9EURO|nr:hypothetical protein DSM5745_04916 [Aspergillus mulundensis]RDW81359.1 hypothetical protein DSM5745_04916 [Aspergillus mulundensis]